MLTLACENILFSSLFASLSGEERGETDVFAGYANFGGEKKKYNVAVRVSILENRRESLKLNVINVLVLESKALYYSPPNC